MLPLPPGGALHLLVLAAIAAVLSGLAAVERKGAFQLMLSRPLVLAPVLGWLLGDAHGGLLLGVPLELLDELRHSDPAKRPVLAAAATRLARLLAPHPLFAL